ncbi:MAG: hypothetical protein ACI8P0_001935 [Planctomycetaceae bacterium]|jgi:hypothetical protein
MASTLLQPHSAEDISVGCDRPVVNCWLAKADALVQCHADAVSGLGRDPEYLGEVHVPRIGGPSEGSV